MPAHKAPTNLDPKDKAPNEQPQGLERTGIYPVAKAASYPVSWVAYSLVIGYLVTCMLTMHNLHHWAQHLTISERTQELARWIQAESKRTAILGLDKPGSQLEAWFTKMHDAATSVTVAEFLRRSDTKIWPPQIAPSSLPPIDAPKALLIGDSLMAMLGPTLKQTISTNLNGDATVLAKIGTGLSRPDFYNWPKALKQSTDATSYDIVFILLGTNDSQNLTENGIPVRYGSSQWVHLYRKRLSDIMDITCRSAQRGYWLGLPPMRDTKLHRKSEMLNILARNAIAKHDCMHFVSLKPVVASSEGRFATYLRIDHQDIKVRTGDGIHFTTKGSQLIANYLLSILRSPPPVEDSPAYAEAGSHSATAH
jgi:hypothetical protein